ncbi:MAG: hypothetical protein FWC70_06345 [Defluviitaleaceae bacterium]|nr:hypothetical protein [Defluviitaleaceae bacterium]
MKKIFLTATFLSAAILFAACIESGYPEARCGGATPRTEADTFSRHLEGIRHLAETSDSPELSEHEMQLHRLREFAANLNAGGTELDDLRITRIWGHPNRSLGTWCDVTEQARQVSFDLTFYHEDDFNNAELIAEMLDFAGIPADEIDIRPGGAGWVILWGQVADFEFMLGNRAVYEVVRPYLRLREFAMNANSGTIYRDDVIVTMIEDAHQHQPLGEAVPSHFSSRFRVGLSAAANRDEISEEMLAFAGLAAGDVQFVPMDAHSWYTEQDFLRVNEEMGQFYLQFERLRQFSELVQVRTARRGVMMETVMLSWSPAGSRGAGSGFHVDFAEKFAGNSDLEETLLFFTGISRDNIDFGVCEGRIFGWTPTRQNLTPEQNADLDALEAFKREANAPFWADRDIHDPVIVRIGFDGDWNFDTGQFYLTNFAVFLYDPDLTQISALKDEIISATGVENINLRAYVSRESLW